jgi:pimeloyl-ACP methyl ester carboxylesterase
MPIAKVRDAELHYQILGSGDDVVLIHGLGANLAFWYWAAKRVSAGHRRILMYDLRGHGRSSMPGSGYNLMDMCEDLRCLLDHLGIERAHIVGHSYGARVALSFTGLHPERTNTLTVADTQVHALQPTLRLRDWSHWEKWKRDLVAGGMRRLPHDDAMIDFRLLASFNEYSHDLVNRGRRAGRRRLSMKSRDMGAKGGRRWSRLLETTTAGTELSDETPLTKDFFSAIQVPTLLLYGRYSHCLLTSEALLLLIPDSRRVLIPGAGHFHPAVKPILFSRVLDPFLAGVDPEEAGTSMSRTGEALPIRRRALR